MQEALKVLDTPVQYLKGVGPYLAGLLEKLGIKTLEDLLYHLPHRYLDRRKTYSIRELPLGEEVVFLAKLLTSAEAKSGFSRKRIFQAIFSDSTGHIQAKWFQYYSGFSKKFAKDHYAILSGKVEIYRGEKQIVHPEIEWLGAEFDPDSFSTHTGILPVYPLTEGLQQKTLRKIVSSALDKFFSFESLPPEIVQTYNFPSLKEAFFTLHQPKAEEDLILLEDKKTSAHRRLIFEEFFFLELALALKKKGVQHEAGVKIDASREILDQFYKTLPFIPTGAQYRTIEEILKNMNSGKPMQRLLQGDVGSGKTLVAAAAALSVIQKNYQVCFMVPTEILAEQQAKNLEKFLKPFGVSVALLKSDLPTAAKKARLKEIEEGRVQLVVGTHALIQEDVSFANLALAIIDEQHRFGVLQRAEMKKKGSFPHLLVMTATPIPRTLAMTVYGDLDVSILDELPANRKAIYTRQVYSKEISKMYQFIREQIQKGRQAYFVYPLVEASEKLDLKNATEMFEKIKRDIFPEFEVGLLHGKMRAIEKEQALQQFVNHKTQILVATTVVEVGVDVPNATLMVVEHAERFGLSQLHQIRGRVGRGSEKSYCFLVPTWPLSENAVERLKTLCKTQDGFEIAEADLNIRGPGDFMGTRQSGLPDFRIANLVRDLPLLEKARKEAFEFLQKDPDFTSATGQGVNEILKHHLNGRFQLAQVG